MVLVEAVAVSAGSVRTTVLTVLVFFFFCSDKVFALEMHERYQLWYESTQVNYLEKRQVNNVPQGRTQVYR